MNLLSQDDEDTLIRAASYIQNQCFRTADAKKMVHMRSEQNWSAAKNVKPNFNHISSLELLFVVGLSTTFKQIEV